MLQRERKEAERRLRESRHLQGLLRWNHIMLCAAAADHYLHLMEVHPVRSTIENLWSIDGTILAFVMSYGRAFADANDGLPKLDFRKVYGSDDSLVRIHERVVSLRNERYAHAGASDTIRYELDIVGDGERITVRPRIHLGIPGDEFSDYRRLVNALQAYVYGRIHNLCAKASTELGFPVDFPEGPPPEHRNYPFSG